MSKANSRQEGGNHYKVGDLPEHWDLVRMYQWDYFQAQITKYLMRWKEKHPTPEKRLEDLKKAAHFLQKYIEDAKHWDLLTPTVVESYPRPRTQADIDHEWNVQIEAGKTFDADGFTKEGTWYQCIYCRQRLLAGSPLGALQTHGICAAAPVPVPPVPMAP